MHDCTTPDKQATLQVANGDRAKALKMLEDPDALMANGNIQEIIAQGAQTSDLEVLDGQYPEGSPSVDGGRAGEAGGSREAGVAKNGATTTGNEFDRLIDWSVHWLFGSVIDYLSQFIYVLRFFLFSLKVIDPLVSS